MVKRKLTPRERRWQERTRARTWLPPANYYLREVDIAAIEAINGMRRLASFTRRPNLRRACQHDIARHLIRLKNDRERLEFGAIVKRECGFGLRRAYQFMAAKKPAKSTGKKTVAQSSPREPAG
jgi:hypothetical protein